MIRNCRKEDWLETVYSHTQLYTSQAAITWSKLTKETLEQGVKYVQSQQKRH